MNNKEITIRSSAAEYLIFVAATGENPSRVELRYEDENIWLTQRMMADQNSKQPTKQKILHYSIHYKVNVYPLIHQNRNMQSLIVFLQLVKTIRQCTRYVSG